MKNTDQIQHAAEGIRQALVKERYMDAFRFACLLVVIETSDEVHNLAQTMARVLSDLRTNRIPESYFGEVKEMLFTYAEQISGNAVAYRAIRKETDTMDEELKIVYNRYWNAQ